jgi:hypothetical protein
MGIPSQPLLALNALGEKTGYGFVPSNAIEQKGDPSPSSAVSAALSSLSLRAHTHNTPQEQN